MNIKYAKKAFITLELVLGLLFLNTAQAAAFELQAEAYVVGDVQTGHILLEHNSRTVLEPASLTKMMTLYLLFEALNNGELTLDSQIEVSKKAWQMGGSKMFIEVGKLIAVEDLIKGITVSSGNDACVAVAERLSGTEEAFAEKMTAKARTLGLADTTFKNASGWPMEGHTSTAADVFKLAQRLVQDFPQFYKYFSERSFTFSGITQFNRNGLLRRDVGVDGLKTGHTESSGYHLVASAKRADMRLIAVVMGTDSMRARESEALKGLSWGFGLYTRANVASAGQALATQAPVLFGLKETTALVAGADASLLVKKSKQHTVSTKLVYDRPLQAPIKAGTVVGRAIFTAEEAPSVEVPLIAAEDIGEKNIFGRWFDQLKSWAFSTAGVVEEEATNAQ